MEAPAIGDGSWLNRFSEEDFNLTCRAIKSMDCFDHFVAWMVFEHNVEQNYKRDFGTIDSDPEEDLKDFREYQKKVKKIDWDPLQFLGENWKCKPIEPI